MATYAKFNRAVTDDAGNLILDATVCVRRMTAAKPLQPVFKDPFGQVPLQNPFSVADGDISFCCAGGFYEIRVTSPSRPGFEKVLEWEPIGTMAGFDHTDLAATDALGFFDDWDLTENIGLYGEEPKNFRLFLVDAFDGDGGWIVKYRSHPAQEQNPNSDTPGNSTAAGDTTYVDRSWALQNGATVESLDLYLTNAGTATVKILQQDSTSQFDVVVSKSFSHPGGGWATVALDSPYVIPSSGTYRVGAHAQVTTLLATTSARSSKAGNTTGSNQTGFATTGTLVFAMRVNYDVWFGPFSYRGPRGGDRYDLLVDDPDRAVSGETMLNALFTTVVTYPAGLLESKAKAGVAPTSEAVFSIRKNGVEFATCTFEAASTVGVFDCPSDTTFDPDNDDELSIVAPDPMDPTLRRPRMTITGHRPTS